MIFIKRVIFWDFDNTLVYRPKMYSYILKMVLDEFEKGHLIKEEKFEHWLRIGFPWHRPDIDHMHLNDPEKWWDSINKVFEYAYIMNGIMPEKACIYANKIRRYITAPEYYCLYEDTIDTLKHFKENGYKNIILSNHIPELPEIVNKIELKDYIDICISSANVGFEKPNPNIFQYALKKAGNPEEVWMIGDNIDADIRGAEAAGIKAILVRKPANEPVRYFSPDLLGIMNIIK